MKVLLVNKFLYPKGGSETYVFKLGEILQSYGHEVQYFGLADERNIVGNAAGSYVSSIDLSKNSMKGLTAPFRIIYSIEARKKIRAVLESMEPDVVHLNNIHFHLTPSVILETKKWIEESGHRCRIVSTAHDYQMICPSHGLFDVNVNVCEKCLSGSYMPCLKTKCMKNSYAKSLLATADAYVWKYSKAYSYIDTIVCPSRFLKEKFDCREDLKGKTVALHNFTEIEKLCERVEKQDYVLEFGNLSKEKGTLTLLEVAKRLPDVKFIFAGRGSAVEEIKKVKNAEYVGFKTGEELRDLIKRAKISVCPSEWYENCPFTVIESQLYLTPVIGSRMGGIPELIEDGKTGLIFEAGNVDELESCIRKLWYIPGLLEEYTENCKYKEFESPKTYYEKIMEIYNE